MFSSSSIDDLVVLASLPAGAVLAWIAHVILTLRRNREALMTRWILLAGLPLAAVALFLWSASIPAPYTGVAALSGPGTLILMCSAVAAILWFAVGFLEILLQFLVQSLRQARQRRGDAGDQRGGGRREGHADRPPQPDRGPGRRSAPGRG